MVQRILWNVADYFKRELKVVYFFYDHVTLGLTRFQYNHYNQHISNKR